MPLDNYDRRILHFLVHNGESTVNRISEHLDIGWLTVKQHIIKLHSMGYLKYRREEKTIYWNVIN